MENHDTKGKTFIRQIQVGDANPLNMRNVRFFPKIIVW